MKHQVDMCVIGAGSAGVRFARTAAAMGARVAIVEKQFWGGTCVNMGCIPKKLYVYASEYSQHFSNSVNFGWDVQVQGFDAVAGWTKLRTNTFNEIARLNGIYKNLLDKTGVLRFEGEARVLDASQVSINNGEEIINTDKIIIATGATPIKPEFPGAEYVLVSDQIFHLEKLPRSIAILGGGYIAAEFAAILHGLGVETHLIYRGSCFLRGFEEELTAFLAQSYRNDGIHLHFETQVSSIEKLAAGLQINTTKGTLQVDAVLSAIGRRANIEALGLDELDIELSETGFIQVNDNFQTNVESIYALGDVAGSEQLTPVALAQAMALAKHLIHNSELQLPYSLIPSAVFTHPTFATVGLTEQQAMQAQHPVDIYTSEFKPLKHTVSGSTERAMLKLVVCTETQRVLGAHMVGEHADEIIQGLAVALTAGATKQHFDRTLGIHPSLAEEFVTMRELKRRV